MVIQHPRKVQKYNVTVTTDMSVSKGHKCSPSMSIRAPPSTRHKRTIFIISLPPPQHRNYHWGTYPELQFAVVLSPSDTSERYRQGTYLRSQSYGRCPHAVVGTHSVRSRSRLHWARASPRGLALPRGAATR